MKRVLLFWREGDKTEFTYISIIPEDYILPKPSVEGRFHEGRIVKDSNNLENMVINVPIIGVKIKHAGSYQFK